MAISCLVFSIALVFCGCARRPTDQTNLDHEFLEAVASGDMETTRQSLRRGAHIEAKNHDGNTALLIVAHQQHRAGEKANNETAILKMLLKNGSNLEVRDQNGSTPLMAAVESGDDATIKLLLDKGAKIEAEDQSGETALMKAAKSGRSDLTDILLERTIDKKSKDRALLAAIVTAPLTLIMAEPPPATQITATAAPRQTSDASHDVTQTIRLLLEKGADIEARDEQGQTPLIRAAAGAQARIVKLLLEKGAYIEAKDTSGATALIASACGGCVSIDMGDTFECVQVLMAHGANVEAKTTGGSTALMVAASYGQTKILKLLLEKGANVADRDSDGDTALILAAQSGIMTATGMVFTAGCVGLLLDHHSDINARNKKGETALILSVSEPGATEATKIVRLLLRHGADAALKDIHGNTAFSVAKKNGFRRAADLLQKAANFTSLRDWLPCIGLSVSDA